MDKCKNCENLNKKILQYDYKFAAMNIDIFRIKFCLEDYKIKTKKIKAMINICKELLDDE